MQKRIIFRADGNAIIGLGHLIRCAALAEILGEDFECALAIRTPVESTLELIKGTFDTVIHLPASDNYSASEITGLIKPHDIVVLDGYNFKTGYQKEIKSICPVVCIDDLHQWHFVADAVINHAEGVLPGSYSAEKYTSLYLGSQYAILRKPFIEAAKEKRILPGKRKALVTMGGMDTSNTSLKVLKALVKTGSVDEIELVAGKMYPSLPQLKEYILSNKNVKINLRMSLSAHEMCNIMKTCRTIICPASTTLMEACAVKMQIITGLTADNQKGILSGFLSKEAVNSIGSFIELSEEELINKFKSVINSDKGLNEQITHQQELVDGKSPERLKAIFKSLMAAFK